MGLSTGAATIGTVVVAAFAARAGAGPEAQIRIGEYALIHGARIICDAEIEIGPYSLISWNVVLMDSYRVPIDAAVESLNAAVATGVAMYQAAAGMKIGPFSPGGA